MRILKAILLCALIALIGALAAVLLLHREDISAYIASAKQEAAWRDYAYSRARVPKELKGVSILLVGDSFIAGWEPEQHDYLWSTLMTPNAAWTWYAPPSQAPPSLWERPRDMFTTVLMSPM